MKRKRIWIWIVCPVLLVCGVLTWILLGGKQSEPDSAPFSRNSAAPAEQQSHTTDAEDHEETVQAEQSAPMQPTESNERGNAASASESATDAELPEIEIPATDDGNREDDKDRTTPPSETGSAASVKPTSTPASTEKPQTDPPESNDPKPTPEPSADPTPEPDNSDIVTDHNGDILLPEVP